MPRLEGPPPALAWSDLDCRACIDYLKLGETKKMRWPKLSRAPELIFNKSGRFWLLTVHDPARADVDALGVALPNSTLMGLEVSIDLWPKPHVADTDRDLLLRETHKAVAGRFRPEDRSFWHHGLRGKVSKKNQPPEQFHTRFPRLDEELLYGSVYEWMQAKVYFKTRDQNVDLPRDEHRIRLELTLTREAIKLVGLDKVQDLIGYSFRKTFATHFRFVQEPALRWRRNRTAAQTAALSKQMQRAWKAAGVGKFAPAQDAKPDSSKATLGKIAQRAKRQLDAADFRLTRDKGSNAKVGSALQLLDRRMA